MNNLKKLYFEWLCSKIQGTKSYSKLLSYLIDTEFEYLIPLDGNRYEDGINLRYIYGEETGCSQAMIACELDTNKCSMLEMMVALSIRCEEHIMSNDEFGDRTGTWFWSMIKNLGLHTMTNQFFDKKKADLIIERFTNHEYSENGEGGLFTVNCGRDLRSEEIWYQMNWYISENYKGEIL